MGRSDWYHFDEDGWMEDGWFQWEDHWYYLHTEYDGFRAICIQAGPEAVILCMQIVPVILPLEPAVFHPAVFIEVIPV